MKIAMDPEGISLSRRRITLSTSGVVPEIAKTAQEIGCQLAISFHATTDEVRDKLVPINKKWNLTELLDALRTYPKVSNSERITFEYVMLKDVNDTDEDARRLVKLIKGIPAKINLIPFNEWPGSPYVRSNWSRIEAFADIIYKAGYASPIRTPRGEDIMAACGQLKSATERARKSKKQSKPKQTFNATRWWAGRCAHARALHHHRAKTPMQYRRYTDVKQTSFYGYNRTRPSLPNAQISASSITIGVNSRP